MISVRRKKRLSSVSSGGLAVLQPGGANTGFDFLGYHLTPAKGEWEAI